MEKTYTVPRSVEYFNIPACSSTAIKSAIKEYKTKKLMAMNEGETPEEAAEQLRMEEEEDDESEGEQVRSQPHHRHTHITC